MGNRCCVRTLHVLAYICFEQSCLSALGMTVMRGGGVAPVSSVYEAVAKLLARFDGFSVDRSVTSQSQLDLVNRRRTSLFPWRGQFSPELIEVLLREFAASKSVVVDPFVGSGTTLFEAAARSFSTFGAEINPAAVVMASTAHFMNLELTKRNEYIRAASALMQQYIPDRQLDGPLFRFAGLSPLDSPPLNELLQALMVAATPEPLVYNLIANAVIRFMQSPIHDQQMLRRSFAEHTHIVEHLAFCQQPCRVFHSDARCLPLDDGSVDLIVTSPPYINVLNYHQNHRPAMELLGWNLLEIAQSEFGSNRKNRGNRFLTVVQYTLDMEEALREMRRLIGVNGRVIVVVGRESTVRGVPFQNGRIVAALAEGSANLRLLLRQERRFKTRFGELIYEDILHFAPVSNPFTPTVGFAQCLAEKVLNDARTQAREDVQVDITAAVDRVASVRVSPHYRSARARSN